MELRDLKKNENGALREKKEGKGRFDLLPYFVFEELAKHLEEGAKIHGDNNWRNGLDIPTCYGSALRHLLKAINSKYLKNDNESLLYHLRAVIFNIMVIIEEIRKKDL